MEGIFKNHPAFEIFSQMDSTYEEKSRIFAIKVNHTKQKYDGESLNSI